MGNNFIYISSHNVRWLIVLSFIFALVLDSINLLGDAYLFLPPFTLLVLLYWAGNFLDYTYISTAFVIGLLADTLMHSTLGIHALIYISLTFLMLRNRLRFRGYSSWQQSLIIIGFTLLYQTLNIFSLPIDLNSQQQLSYWLMPFVSGLIWFVLASVLNRLSQQNAVNN